MAELQKDPVTRGQFLGMGIVGTLVGAVMTIPPIVYVLNPTIESNLLGQSDVPDDWHELGSVFEIPSGAPKLYRELRDKISEAAAAARSDAEIRVFRDTPFQWLRYGPGRERPGEPGWTEPSQTVLVETGPETIQILDERESPEYRTRVLAEAIASMVELGHLPMPEPTETARGNGNGEIIDVASSEEPPKLSDES